MRFRTGRDRLSGGYRRTRHLEDGSQKDTRSSGLVPANYRHRSTPVPRVHRILSVLYPKLLKNRPTTPGPYEEDNPVALGPIPVQSIRNPENPHVQETRSTPTQLCKTILPPNRRIGIWRGR